MPMKLRLALLSFYADLDWQEVISPDGVIASCAPKPQNTNGRGKKTRTGAAMNHALSWQDDRDGGASDWVKHSGPAYAVRLPNCEIVPR